MAVLFEPGQANPLPGRRWRPGVLKTIKQYYEFHDGDKADLIDSLQIGELGEFIDELKSFFASSPPEKSR
jgi:hypothetical protein